MSVSVSAHSSGNDHGFHHWRARFRAWRGTRPFWAGLFAVNGGGWIIWFAYSDIKFGQLAMNMGTTGGAGALIIGVLLVTLGLTMWYQQAVRIFAGVASILLGIVSIPSSNLGGFFIGFVSALIGGGLAIAWAPGKPVPAAGGQADPAAAIPAPSPAADAKAAAWDDAMRTMPLARTEPAPPRPGHAPEPGANATDTSFDADGGRNSAG
ncbi:DUF6114 domain-containing protein [Streptomyces sp. NPDC050504]|uniref:DUF6114 domain-containing protein n=1 Tax=Streptomyces sp. NPDC050504 TaxID=3365618 RepID=UPI0037A68AD8